MKHLQNNKITKFLLISFLISWGFGWGLLAFLTQMSLLSL
ncbi:CPBP family intramembrane metalloprotease, partial [Streptococcus mitis]|nr:CPBP family intramembrane metalloprotease [Streptococcus mitis]